MMNTELAHQCARPLVRALLQYPGGREWSIQGLGMLRLYLSETLRLHVWHSGFAFEPKPSELHDHPWHFRSLVVAGRMLQKRYVPDRGGAQYSFYTILCGEGGGPTTVPYAINLAELDQEEYLPGQEYSQRAHEIHRSYPQDGTVTIVERTFLEDADHARVFWRGGGWISAEPRPATVIEVSEMCAAALGRLE